MDGSAVCGHDGQDGLFASAVTDNERGALIVKVANTSNTPQTLRLHWSGKKRDCNFSKGEVITLHNDNPDAENTLDRPDLILPVTTQLTDGAWTADGYTDELPAETFRIYIFTK
jgi:alpha-L-arabinofuranosidase